MNEEWQLEMCLHTINTTEPGSPLHEIAVRSAFAYCQDYLIEVNKEMPIMQEVWAQLAIFVNDHYSRTLAEDGIADSYVDEGGNLFNEIKPSFYEL